MEDKNKYYQPEIEEFHVGFEYEIMDEDNAQWGSFIIKTQSDLVHATAFIDYLSCRVKHLDREDIESFGFSTEDGGECYNKQESFTLYSLFPWDKENEYKICIERDDVFVGVIKNKSELIKVLRMAGIYERA